MGHCILRRALQVVIQTILGSTGSFPFITFPESQDMEAVLEIKFGESSCIFLFDLEFLHARESVAVVHRDFV